MVLSPPPTPPRVHGWEELEGDATRRSRRPVAPPTPTVGECNIGDARPGCQIKVGTSPANPRTGMPAWYVKPRGPEVGFVSTVAAPKCAPMKFACVNVWTAPAVVVVAELPRTAGDTRVRKRFAGTAWPPARGCEKVT